MAEPLTYQDVLEEYRKHFGEYPKITGANFWRSGDIIEDLIIAIDTDTPYSEPVVPEGADV